MLKFFRTPFATGGDKTAVPDAIDLSGNVSYQEGYGFDYQRQSTDPARKVIERDKMNELFFDTTTAIAELQAQGVPDFITSALNGGSAYSYAINALVRWTDGAVYQSLAATNTATPADATKWAKLPTAALLQGVAATKSVATGTADALAAAFVPAITALPPAPGTLSVLVRAAAVNTSTTPTFAADALAAKTIVKNANAALVAGDIAGAGHWLHLQYDAALDKWVLLNPAVAASTTYIQAGAGAVMRTAQNRLRDGWVNVKDYGAVADGTTDDTAAINAAAAAIGYQGVLYFPHSASAYVITSQIVFTGPVKIKGDGEWQSVIRADGFASGVAIFKWYSGTPFTYINGAGMEGLYVTSNNALPSVAELLYTVKSKIQDIWVANMQHGILSTYGWSNTFKRIYHYDTKGVCYWLQNSENNLIIEGGTVTGTTAGSRGVLIEGGSSSTSAVDIRNVDFEGFTTLGSIAIRVQPAAGQFVNNLSIHDNYFEGIAGTCVSIAPTNAGGVKSLNLQNNRFWGGYAGVFGSVSGYAAQAIYLSKAYGVQITGNQFDDFQTNCIYSNNDSDTGQVQWNTYKTGLTVKSAADTAFTTANNKAF